MMSNLLQVITNPDAFFSEKMKSAEDKKTPFIIVAIVGLISAVYGYQVGLLSAQIFEGTMAGIGQFIIVSAVAGAFFGVLIAWAAVTIVLYLISMALKGNGSFMRSLECLGYGFIPQVFGGLATLAVGLYYLPMVQVSPVRSLTDPTAVQAAVTQMMANPVMRELTQISTVIAIIFLLWSANIWIFGMKHARSLTTKNAMIAVLIPVTIYCIYSLYTAFIGIPFTGA
jgi:hypothetical protein